MDDFDKRRDEATDPDDASATARAAAENNVENSVENNVENDADAPVDPNDEVPVPIAMWPSEIDERAQVVEALRGNAPPPRTDSQVDPA
jgi:hypothetical protein